MQRPPPTLQSSSAGVSLRHRCGLLQESKAKGCPAVLGVTPLVLGRLRVGLRADCVRGVRVPPLQWLYHMYIARALIYDRNRCPVNVCTLLRFVK